MLALAIKLLLASVMEEEKRVQGSVPASTMMGKGRPSDGTLATLLKTKVKTSMVSKRLDQGPYARR